MFGYQKEGVQKVISTFNGCPNRRWNGIGKDSTSYICLQVLQCEEVAGDLPCLPKVYVEKGIEKWVPGIVSSVIKTEKTLWMLSHP